MEQVRTIEEVLAEFRQKYNAANSENAENPKTGETFTAFEPVIAVKSRISRGRRNEYGFIRIIASQAAAALVIAAALAALKLLNPGLFSAFWGYISSNIYV